MSLHFDRIERWLEQAAVTPYGRERFAQHPHARGVELERRVDAAAAWRKLLDAGEAPHFGLEIDIRPMLQRLQRGGQLDAEELRDIRAAIEVLFDLLGASDELPPPIAGLTSAIGEYDDERSRLRASVGDDGKLLDTASADLGNLRRALEGAKRRHGELAESTRKELQAGGHLQDDYITQRSEHHVLPIKASDKRKFGGVIHDSSRSGKTAYVEPAAMLEAAQAVRQAEEAVEEEIKRILRRLSAIVGLRANELGQDLGVLATIDTDRCAGLFGQRFDGVPANLAQGVKLRGLRPPALLLAEVESVVPIDVEMGERAPVLVISGSNGGGKTVALTAIAWCFELAQRGLPIPADKAALPAPPFEIIPVVGDASDDRRDHSTFSGHLHALRQALASAGPSQLILIDEIASGTEPIAGGAIACAVLETIAETGAWVVATTHYDPVKQLALEHDHMRAAAVRDRRDPEVAFRLFADEVGGSHPIKLAIEIGLPDQVIERARVHLDPQRRERLDRLKREAQSAQTIEQERQAVEAQREALEARAAALEADQKKLQSERAKMQAKQAKTAEKVEQLRGEQMAEIEALREELSGTIRELRKRGQDEAAKEGDRLFGAIGELRDQADELRLDAAPEAAEERPIAAGDRVRLFAGGKLGTVQELRGRTAVVLIDGKVFHLRREQLQRVDGPSKRPGGGEGGGRGKKKRSGRDLPIPFTGDQTDQLDLRGLRAHEVEARIDRFLQRLSDRNGLGRIIHGIGTGAVRKATLDALARGPWRVTYRSGQSGEGGDGVTVVRLENG